MSGQLFLGLDVATKRTPGQRRLLLQFEEGDSADLLEIEVQALPAFVDSPRKLRVP
jgi:hypothetical protein